MLYKPSKYNVVSNDFDNNLLIANLLKNKFVKIHEKDVNKVLDILSSEIIEYESLLNYGLLIDSGMVVPSDLDEFEVANLKYYNIAFSNDSLDITIIPTDACNFNCVYCYQENRHNQFITAEAEEKILKFIDLNVGKYKKLLLNWFGGEPLLVKERIINLMPRIKEICSKHNVPLISTMTTNGYELDLASFHSLLKGNLMYYQITLDGNRETHNAQRPHIGKNDSFDKILSNLVQILKNEKGYYRIALRINITETILNNMDAYLNEIKIFANNPRFQIHWQYVKDFGGEQVHELDKSERIYNVDKFLDFIDKATLLGIGSFAYRLFSLGMGLCEASKKNAFYVDHDAKLHKCSIAIYENNYKVVNNIGYIDEKGHLRIDEEKESKWLVRSDLDDECRNCMYFPLCFSHTCPFTRKMRNEKACISEKDELTKLLKYLSKTGIFKELGGDA